MVIERDMTNRRFMSGAIAAGGWTATTILFMMTLATWSQTYEDSDRTHMSSVGWGVETLAVAVVIGALITVLVRDVVRARRYASPRMSRAQVSGLVLCAGAWFFGGLFNLATFVFPVQVGRASGFCGGQGGAGSFACLHRPSPGLIALGVVLSLSATLMLGVLVLAGARSRLSALLSPVVIFGLYLLALRMWLPHEGFGVPNRPILQP
jgi:hypothetical protein